MKFLNRTLLVLSLIIFVKISTPPIYAMDNTSLHQITLEKGMSFDKVIDFLNEEKQKEFLKKTIKIVFLRDKDKGYWAAKLCTHGGNELVEPWKIFAKQKPQSITKQKLWSNMLQRKYLYLFTINNAKSVIESHLDIEPIYITVRRMGGTASDAIVIDTIWNIGNKIGEKYTDDDHDKDMGRTSAGTSYSYKTLTNIKFLCDISDIIKAISETGHIPNDISNEGKISTICPAD